MDCSLQPLKLDDGTPMSEIKTKDFEDWSFDQEGRIFKGTINWQPKKIYGIVKQFFQLEFNEDYSMINGGFIDHIKDDDKKASQTKFGIGKGQNVYFRQESEKED